MRGLRDGARNIRQTKERASQKKNQRQKQEQNKRVRSVLVDK